MVFRTEIDIRPSGDFIIDHTSRGLMAGSCFSENIAGKLKAAKFNVVSNPFGTLFNPVSVSGMFRALAGRKAYTQDDLATDGDMWFSYGHHGSFSDVYPEVALSRMNAAVEAGGRALDGADYVVVTFGTAWVYRLASSGEVAANCHKQPQELFIRQQLTVGEIVDAYSELLEGALKDKAVVFTVSPVRHLKDGFDGNSLSKAILRVAAGELAGKYANVLYFPAYEILTDDLRDYRFYADDMVHPSPRAVDYIWEKFTQWCMDKRTLALLPRIGKVSAAMEHRLMNPGSSAGAGFMEKMHGYVRELQAELASVDFSNELKYFSGDRIIAGDDISFD